LKKKGGGANFKKQAYGMGVLGGEKARRGNEQKKKGTHEISTTYGSALLPLGE